MCVKAISCLPLFLQAQVVINWEFPETPADYLHRSGRLGRLGSSGTGVIINFVQHKWEVEKVQEIEVSQRRMHPSYIL